MTSLLKTKTPSLPEPSRLPDRESSEAESRKRQLRDASRKRGGRESTILSKEVGGKLGAS